MGFYLSADAIKIRECDLPCAAEDPELDSDLGGVVVSRVAAWMGKWRRTLLRQPLPVGDFLLPISNCASNVGTRAW